MKSNMLLLVGHCKAPCKGDLCTEAGQDQSVSCRASICVSTVIVLVAGVSWSHSRESEVRQSVLSEDGLPQHAYPAQRSIW